MRHPRHQEDQNDAVSPTGKRPVRAFEPRNAQSAAYAASGAEAQVARPSAGGGPGVQQHASRLDRLRTLLPALRTGAPTAGGRPAGTPSPHRSRGSRLVRQHRLRLQEAHHKASDQLKQAAAKMARYTDKGAADQALQVGDHVYLRNRVLGRHKIQDFWRPELHRVTARPFDNVYMTQPLAGGPERAVNRKDVMPATAPFVVNAADQQSPSSRPDVSDSD